MPAARQVGLNTLCKPLTVLTAHSLHALSMVVSGDLKAPDAYLQSRALQSCANCNSKSQQSYNLNEPVGGRHEVVSQIKKHHKKAIHLL